MSPLYQLNTRHLWVVLLLLQIPVAFVGCKASPSSDLLKRGGHYTRPLQALEMSDNGPSLFNKWDDETKRDLRHALYWDFGFIPLYVSSLFIACLLAARWLGGSEILRAAFLLTAPAAGLFDFIENVILLKLIRGPTADTLVSTARISTACKIAFLGLAAIYVLIGLLSWVYVRFIRH